MKVTRCAVGTNYQYLLFKLVPLFTIHVVTSDETQYFSCLYFLLQNIEQLSDLAHALALKAPITTAADNKFCDIFPNFQKK